MVISENIQYIRTSNKWAFFENKSYCAKIQKGHADTVYNVPERMGIVYNILEDSFEPVNDSCYIVTGAAGEMWPISEKALKKYDIAPEKITDLPQEVRTIPTDTVFAGIRIPAQTAFTLEVDYGEKCVLRGNREGIGHDAGDWILVAAKQVNGEYVPDFEDAGRIVNGEIFSVLYQPYPPKQEAEKEGEHESETV